MTCDRSGWSGRTSVLAALALLWLPAVAQAAETPCAGLEAVTIAAGAIGLPTTGARVLSAESVAASPATTNTNGTFVAASPEYCKLLGCWTRQPPQI